MKAVTVQKGIWYKIYTDDNEYIGQVMQKVGSCNRPTGSWGFALGNNTPPFGHNYKSPNLAIQAMIKKFSKQFQTSDSHVA